jgi:hypothetical protein
MANEGLKNLIQKLREIEQQCAQALGEIPTGLTHSRIRHARTLAKFCRMALEGQPVHPVEHMHDEPAGDRKSH